MNDLSHEYENGIRIGQYRVDAVMHPTDLRALKPDWDALFDQDPDAGVFLSYDWLEYGLLANPNRWRIFVVRDKTGVPVCIFPTKQRVHWSKTYNQFQTEIEAAGRLAWGEYTGFICRIDQEEDALKVLAQALEGYPWKSLSLRYEPTLRRSRIFAEAFGEAFSHQFRPYRINKGEIDNLVSLKVPIEAGFENVLASRVSSNTRQKIRRYRRKLLETGTYRITTASSETMERDIAGLLRNWVDQWSTQKGTDKALEIADRYGRALLTAESTDSLYLPVLWQGDKMLGALGHVVDKKQGCVNFLVAGRNSKATDPAIGLLLHAQAIEWAADAGYRAYDFGHGDQSYKLSFGPEKTRSHYLNVRRAGDKSVLDIVSLRPALQRLANFAQEGKADRIKPSAEQLASLLDPQSLHQGPRIAN